MVNLSYPLDWLTSSLVAAGAGILAAALILALRPLLVRYALARPNARSSHVAPTPQGAGAAVIAATFAVAGALAAWSGAWLAPFPLGILAAATLLIAVVGAVDDIRTIPVAPRLVLQAACIGLVLAALPAGFRIFPSWPPAAELALLLFAGLWFVNLVNFMDGLDWMTVAEIVPVTGALVLLGALGALPWQAGIVSLALFGAMIGFAPFNKPVARLFLGDVGSLPIGLLLGWLLLMLAGNGNLAAAILLPLYYLADATITLVRRLVRREPIWQAHRTHFYQRATDNGYSVMDVVTRVFALNLALAALATATVTLRTAFAAAAALVLGALLVSWLLATFSRRRA